MTHIENKSLWGIKKIGGCGAMGTEGAGAGDAAGTRHRLFDVGP